MIKIIVLLLALLTAAGAYGIGRGPGGRSAALGGAYSAIAYGIESYAFNPAGMASGKSLAVMLGSGGATTLTWEDAKNLYSQLSTSTGRTQYLVNHILQEIKINGQGDVPFVGLSFGNLGLASWGYAYGYADKAAIDYQFILFGGYILEYGLIYGNSFSALNPALANLYWGITVRGITGGERGLYYSALDWDYAGDGSVVNYGREYSVTWNNGLGGDLGIKYEGDNYSIAFAVKDLSTSLNQKTELNFRQVDWNNGTLGGLLGTYESTASVSVDPRWLLGFAYYFEKPGLLVTTDIERYKTSAITLSDPDFGKSVQVIDLHLGLEKKLSDWFSLRAGFSAENYAKIPENWLTYGFGLNLGAFNLDLAAGSCQKSSQVYVQAQTSL